MRNGQKHMLIILIGMNMLQILFIFHKYICERGQKHQANQNSTHFYTKLPDNKGLHVDTMLARHWYLVSCDTCICNMISQA